MKLILDTNVFISAVFFGGLPYRILNAWRQGKIQLIISPEILDEYRRIGKELSARYNGVNLEPMLELLTVHAQLVESPALPEAVCTDPDDDKFIACAIASGAKIITSGDRHLLAVSGYHGITVLPPRAFVDQFLSESK